MALTTYAGLKSAIASWVHRTDLTTQIPDFVALAEAGIARDLRVQAMESLATGTLTGETLAFPTRFLEARRLTLNGKTCDYCEPLEYQELKDAGSTKNVYTILGQSFYILQGTNGDTYSLLHYAMFAGLSGDSDTNWLLTTHPDIYLYGSLMFAATWTQDEQAMGSAAALYKAALDRLADADMAAKFSGQLAIKSR